MGSWDVILLLRIRGGWIYEYTCDGETLRGFDCDPAQAKARLLCKLDWTRFDRV